eukprot:800577-Pyramimonas_sp.AAC.1
MSFSLSLFLSSSSFLRIPWADARDACAEPPREGETRGVTAATLPNEEEEGRRRKRAVGNRRTGRRRREDRRK